MNISRFPSGFFGGNVSEITLGGVKCRGNEDRLDSCMHAEPDKTGVVACPGPPGDVNIAGVTCVHSQFSPLKQIFYQ